MFANKQTILALALASPALAMEAAMRGIVKQYGSKYRITAGRSTAVAHGCDNAGETFPGARTLDLSPPSAKASPKFKKLNQQLSNGKQTVTEIGGSPQRQTAPVGDKKCWISKNWGKLVVGVGMAAGTGVLAGLDLAAIDPTNAQEYVFNGREGFQNDAGWVGAGLIMGGIAIGLTLIVAAVMKRDNNVKFNLFFYLSVFFTFLGSGALMAGLNLVQTNATDAVTAIANGFNPTAEDIPFKAELCQILLIVGSAMMGLVLIFIVVSLFRRCFNKNE